MGVMKWKTHWDPFAALLKQRQTGRGQITAKQAEDQGRQQETIIQGNPSQDRQQTGRSQVTNQGQ